MIFPSFDLHINYLLMILNKSTKETGPQQPKSPISAKATKKKQRSDVIDRRQAWGPVPGVKVTFTVLLV